MHPVVVFDFIFFVASLIGLAIILQGPGRTFKSGTKRLIAGLVLFNLIYSFLLGLEWSGITTAMETLEDFIGALIPMWWAFVFYAIMQEITTGDLARSEDKYRTLVEQTPLVTYTASIDDVRSSLYVSPQIKTMLGFEPEQWLEKASSWASQIHPDDRKRVLNKLKESHQANGNFVSEYRMFAKDKQQIWIHDEAAVVKDDSGKALFIQGVMSDITKRKLVEQEREGLLKVLASKNEELESIIYVSSHDFRTPLLNVQGYTSELGDSCKQLKMLISQIQIPEQIQKQLFSLLNEDIPTSLDFINSGAKTLDTLQNGLLRLCRLGYAALNIQPLDINSLICDVVRNMQYKIDNSGVTLNVGELPECIGDQEQISQLFANLLDNAIKYLDPNRKGMIKVTGKIYEKMSVYCVEDNGIGIAPEHFDKVFEVFYRLSPKLFVEGDGLGLSIVSRIADRHDGKVWIESDPEKGSRFYVSLPNSAERLSSERILAKS